MRLLLILLLSGCFPSAPPPPAPTPTPSAPGASAALPPPLHQGDNNPTTWGFRPDSQIERRAAANQIPQLADRWELFGQLKDGPVPSVAGGVLVCDLRLPGSKWWQSRPDMQAMLTIGSTKQTLIGENNRDATVVTAPLASLNTGDSIQLSVEDRDLLTKNDFIDAGKTEFPGAFPLLITGLGGKLHSTCRLLRPDAVAERLAGAVTAAERGVSGFERARGVDLRAQDLGYPWTEHQTAESSMDAVAGLVGWSHAELTDRRRRFTEAKAAQMRTLADAVQTQLAKATPVGRDARRPGDTSFRVDALICGEDARARFGDTAPQCALQFGGTGTGVDLVWPDGRTEALTPLEGHPGYLAASTPLGGESPQKAVLARVADQGGVQFWKMP